MPEIPAPPATDLECGRLLPLFFFAGFFLSNPFFILSEPPISDMMFLCSCISVARIQQRGVTAPNYDH